MDKTPALYDLDAQFKEIDALLESAGGDLDATANGTALGEWLEKNEIATKEKIDSYCFIIERFYGDADVCAEMIRKLKERQQAHVKKAERLESVLKQSMELRKIEKIPAPAHTIWLQRAGKAPLEIIDEKLIPERFYKTKIERVLDKEALREAVESGDAAACLAAKIGEVKMGLRIK